MTSRVLVTGAGGFVCRHIVEALLKAGYAIVAVDKAFDEALRQRWVDKPIQWFETDAENLPDVSADYLIHGAAITASPEEINQTPEEHFRANMNSTLAALAWAREQRVQRAVFISSAAVLRESREKTLNEESLAPVIGLYMAAKQATEALVATMHKEYGQNMVSIRLGNVYGSMEYSRPTRPRVSKVMGMILEAMETHTLAVPHESATLDWTFALDIGLAVVALLNAPSLSHDLYHIASPEAQNDLDIAQAIQSALAETTLELQHKPLSPARGVLTSMRLTADTGFSDWTPFHEGIRQTVAWALAEREHSS